MECKCSHSISVKLIHQFIQLNVVELWMDDGCDNADTASGARHLAGHDVRDRTGHNVIDQTGYDG